MRRIALAGLLTFGVITIPLLGGCNDTVHEHRTVEHDSDGTVTKETRKTVRSDDGTTETTVKKSVDRSY